MINYVTQDEFISTFKKIRPENFSYENIEIPTFLNTSPID